MEEVEIRGGAIKPGKPVIIGNINNRPVIGILGYPVSAYFIMELIVKQLIIKVLKSKEFTNELDKLGGYDYFDIGDIVKIYK